MVVAVTQYIQFNIIFLNNHTFHSMPRKQQPMHVNIYLKRETLNISKTIYVKTTIPNIQVLQFPFSSPGYINKNLFIAINKCVCSK